MAKLHDEITAELREWIGKQQMFFVGTAPLAGDGHVNCSPKGTDSFRVLGPNQVGYLDYTGSGAETIAHIRENGRILFMFCAFEGGPKILRLHGQARFITPDSAEWNDHLKHFPQTSGVRSIILADITRVCDSCGFAVPEYQFVQQRKILEDWSDKTGEAGVIEYQQKKNVVSIDGLPALDPKS